MNSGQNSVIPQFGGGGDEWSKAQKFLFSSQSTENQKLYNISENQPPKSIRSEDMEIPPFRSRKSAAPPLSPLQIELV